MSFSKLLFLAFLTALTASCVSVGFPPPEAQKNPDVEFKSPESPFDELTTNNVDHAWRNKKNGNTISYLSECNNSNDPSLENIYKGITAQIEDVETIEMHRIEYNSRETIHSTVQGKVDGLVTNVQLLVFKKNNCTYVITYAGLAKDFAQDQRTFENFVKRFRAP